MAIKRNSNIGKFVISLIAIIILCCVAIGMFVKKDSLVNVVAYTWVFIVPILVILIPRATLCLKIAQHVDVMTPIGASILCFIPCVNVLVTNKRIKGSYGKGATAVTIYIYAVAFLSIAARLVFSKSVLTVLVTSVLMCTAMVIYFLQDIVFNWKMCTLFDKSKDRVWAVLMPPVCSYLLSNQVNRFFKLNKDYLEGTFDGQTGNKKQPNRV